MEDTVHFHHFREFELFGALEGLRIMKEKKDTTTKGKNIGMDCMHSREKDMKPSHIKIVYLKCGGRIYWIHLGHRLI